MDKSMVGIKISKETNDILEAKCEELIDKNYHARKSDVIAALVEFYAGMADVAYTRKRDRVKLSPDEIREKLARETKKFKSARAGKKYDKNKSR